jgi:hypothetical protein
MKQAEALDAIRGYARANRIVIARGHPGERAQERTRQYGDIHAALSNAKSAKLQENGRWRVRGQDLDGDDLTIVVIIENGLIVVTVM